MTAWALACPRCGGALAVPSDDRRACVPCRTEYVCVDGIWRFVVADGPTSARYERFLAEYTTIRRAEGRGAAGEQAWRALPEVPRHDPLAAQWAMRAMSWRRTATLVLAGPTPRRVLDLGAGVGWLAHRAAALGHRPLAVDLSVDALDGLGAAAPHVGGRWPLVQASFDHLPLADAQADVTIFNASLHYSEDLAVTMREAVRVTAPGGAVVVMDSPIYSADEPGRAMVAERAADFERRFGTRSDALASVGYLTDASIAAAGAAAGLVWDAAVPWYGWRWAVRPWVARWRGGRERARFAVLVARRR